MIDKDASAFVPFYIKDCTLAAIATGAKAQTLAELRDRIIVAHPSSVYFHFWEGRLRTAFEHREYHNDFANWIHTYLHDDILAERLDLINPMEYDDIEFVRADLIGLINNRIEEIDYVPWVKSEDQFEFVRSKIIIFSTSYHIHTPHELVSIFPLLTHSSIFYHVIDAARRLPEKDNDFSAWLSGFGNQYADLCSELRRIDPYFISMEALQAKIYGIFTKYFLGTMS